MTQNIIDVSWDLPKFDAQTQSVLANMQKVYELANLSLTNGIKPGSDGGYTELIKNNAAFNKVQESTLRLTKLQEQAEQARLRTQKLTQDAILAESKARKANADAAIKEAAAKKKAAETAPNTVIDGGSRDVGGGVASAEVTAAFEAQRQSEADASMAATEYGNSVNKSTEQVQASIAVAQESATSSKELESAKLALAKANSIENESIQGYNVQTQAANKAAKEQAMVTHGMLSPYQLLNKQYIAAAANAKDLSAEFGVNSKEAQAAQLEASGLNLRLKEIDSTVGLSGRHVGDYSGALANAFGRVTNLGAIAARTVQMLGRQIIGLGVGMLSFVIGAKALEAIGNYISKMYDQWAFSAGNAERKQFELQNRIDELNKTVEDSAKAFEDATSNLAKLTIDVDLAKRGFLDKDKVLKEYNDTMGETTGKLKNFDDMEAKLVADGPDYIKLLFLKAEATASFAQAAIAAMKAITAQADAEKDFGNIDFIAANKMNILKQALGIGSTAENLSNAGINASNQAKKNAAFLKQQAQDSFNALTKQGQDFEQQAAALAKFRGFNFFDEDKTKKKSSRVTMDSTKDQLDIEFEVYKIAQKRKIKLLDDLSNDTKKAFQERLLAANDFEKASIELSDKTSQHEIDNDKLKLDILKVNYAKAKGTEKNNLAVEIRNTFDQIGILQKKQSDSRLSIEDEFTKKYLQITNDTEAERLKIIQEAEKAIDNVNKEQKLAIEANRDSAKAAHDKLLHDKLISQKQYDDAEKKSIKDNAVLSAQVDLQKAQRQRELVLSNPLATQEDKNNANNNVTIANSNLISAQNPNDDKKKEKKDYEIQAAKAVQDTITSLVDVGYQKEIDAIQKIIDLNNQRKDQEIANINASTLSNQEKAAQMIILDSSVAANNEKLQREKVAIQIKQAKFDRDMAILGVVENAAIAEFTPPYSPWKAAAIAIEAAASIATILAKPLPSMPAYAEGTDNHPGGPAIVGEGNLKELVQEPGGKSFIASRPMLLNNLPKGSKVKPLTSDMINEIMYQSMVRGTANMIKQSESRANVSSNKDIIEAIEMGSRMTVQAMRKQRGANVNVYVDTKWNAYISKVVKE